MVLIPLMTILLLQLSIKTSVRAALRRFLVVVIVTIILLAALIPFSSYTIFYERAREVLCGSLLGMLAGLNLFPQRADVAFRLYMVCVLEAYIDYLIAIRLFLFRENDAAVIAQQKKETLEKVALGSPEWIFESGFNPALRQGYRHFLLRMDEVSQVLYAMHYAARYEFDLMLWEDFRLPLQRCMEDAEQAMRLLQQRLNLKDTEDYVPHAAENWQTLESLFEKTVPLPIELLETSENYIHLAAVIYDLKDLHYLLNKLLIVTHPTKSAQVVHSN